MVDNPISMRIRMMAFLNFMTMWFLFFNQLSIQRCGDCRKGAWSYRANVCGIVAVGKKRLGYCCRRRLCNG
jgi:hypothetical protein